MTPTEQDNDLQFCESCSCMTRGNPTCGKCGAWRETETMTPTEQDKELRSLISDVMADLMVDVSLNKLLKNDGDIFENGRQYIKSHNSRLNLIIQLITADRKRVELEARIDALEYAKISPKFKIEERIGSLKQELESL